MTKKPLLTKSEFERLTRLNLSSETLHKVIKSNYRVEKKKRTKTYKGIKQ